MIGNDIEFVVVAVQGGKVRLGVTALRHIPVHRKEIYEIVRREKADGEKRF